MQRESNSVEVVINVDASKTATGAAFSCRISDITYEKAFFKGTYHSAFLPNNLTASSAEAMGVLESMLFLERILHGLSVPPRIVNLRINTDCFYVVSSLENHKRLPIIKDILERSRRFKGVSVKKVTAKSNVFKKVHKTAIRKRRAYSTSQPIRSAR